jgi:hypothetical protein
MESKANKYFVKLISKNSLAINGKGDSEIWNEANILNKFSSPWDLEKPAEIEFKSLWDGFHLFFCFTVYDIEIHIDKKDDTFKSIGESDRVELFFRRDKTLNPYYCLEIDATARIMDFIAYPNKKFDFEWTWPKNDLLVQ